MPDNPAELEPGQTEETGEERDDYYQSKIGKMIDEYPDFAVFLDRFLPDPDYEDPQTHERSEKLIEAYKTYVDLSRAVKESYKTLGKQGLDVEFSQEELDGAVDAWLLERAGTDPEGFAQWGKDWDQLRELEQEIHGKDKEYAIYADYALSKRKKAAEMQESARSAEGGDPSLFDYKEYLQHLQTGMKLKETKMLGVRYKLGAMAHLFGTRSDEEERSMLAIKAFDGQARDYESALEGVEKEFDTLVKGESYLKLQQLREKFFANFEPWRTMQNLMRDKVNDKFDSHVFPKNGEAIDPNKAEETIARVRQMQKGVGGAELFTEEELQEDLQLEAEKAAETVVREQIRKAIDSFVPSDEADKETKRYTKVKEQIDAILAQEKVGYMINQNLAKDVSKLRPDLKNRVENVTLVRGVVSIMEEMARETSGAKRTLLRNLVKELRARHRSVF